MVICFFLYLLGTVGMTLIVVKGVIFQPFRDYVSKRAAQARHIREIRELPAGQRVQFNQAGEAGGRAARRSFIEFFHELISCTQCTGFWCGLFCGIILLTPDASVLILFPKELKLSAVQQLAFPLHYFFVWFCCGAAGSFAASFGDIVLEWAFYNKMVALRKLEEYDRAVMPHETHDNEQHDSGQSVNEH